MERFYFPAISDKDSILCSVQVDVKPSSDNEVIVTGLVDGEIEQSVFIALTLLHNITFNLGCRRIHVHFPKYDEYKRGISASLCIYFTLYECLTGERLFFEEEIPCLVSGEVDLYGNVLSVGGLEKKIDLFTKSQCKTFILPTSNMNEVRDICKFDQSYNEKKIVFTNHINQIRRSLYIMRRGFSAGKVR